MNEFKFIIHEYGPETDKNYGFSFRELPDADDFIGLFYWYDDLGINHEYKCLENIIETKILNRIIK